MSNKTKNIETATDKLGKMAQQTGLLLMTAAVTLGMVEVPEQSSRVVLPSQPSLVFSGNQNGENNSEPNPIRREREETGPHYVSYSSMHRTPGRTGKV